MRSEERSREFRSAPPPAASYIRLPRTFYLRPTLTIARDLPGKYLVRRLGSTTFIGRIVEVEAYLGSRDPASHTYRGMTPRNEVMFSGGGHLYVYFTYGMHYCANVVTGPAGRGHAVLLRAAEPVNGVEVMRSLRTDGGKRQVPERDICRGPARLCQALGIALQENGTDLCGDSIWLAKMPAAEATGRITRSTRIGISSGREHLWRFYLKGNPFVSREVKTKAGE